MSGITKSGMGRGCSAAVEHTPRNLEVVGLNPARCCAFFLFFFSLPLSTSLYLCLLSFTNEVSIIRSLKEVHL